VTGVIHTSDGEVHTSDGERSTPVTGGETLYSLRWLRRGETLYSLRWLRREEYGPPAPWKRERFPGPGHPTPPGYTLDHAGTTTVFSAAAPVGLRWREERAWAQSLSGAWVGRVLLFFFLPFCEVLTAVSPLSLSSLPPKGTRLAP